MLRESLPRCGWVGLLALLALLAWHDLASAQSQGFMVRPMRMETMGSPGQQIDVPLQIRNITGAGSVRVDLRLVELSQSLDGSWLLIEPGSQDTSRLSSSLAWTGLSATTVTAGVDAPADIVARVNIPASARGVYFAGIIAETPAPDETPGAIAIRVRFLIPLIVHISGRPVRQSVALDDVLLAEADKPTEEIGPKASLRIVNNGKTFSRVRGTLQIDRLDQGLWRKVTTVDVPDRGIIPAATLELGSSIQRLLPAGDYKLRGELYVDGRRVRPLEKQIAFAGSPDAVNVAYDTPLLLTPEVVDVTVAAGGTRTTTLRVENPGTDRIDVTMGATTPRSLMAVEMGEVRGADFSAEAWTQVRPSQFTIMPGRSQNVRVITGLPREGAPYPHYYADLTLSGTYKDGQSAGTTSSTVHLANPSIESTVSGRIEQLQLSESDEPGVYVVQANVVNTGNVDVVPRVRTLLLNPPGQAVVTGVLSGDAKPLLPLGRSAFSGELNLADLLPGPYRLRTVATLSSETDVAAQMNLSVERAADGSVVITAIDPAEVAVGDERILPAGEADEGGTGEGQ